MASVSSSSLGLNWLVEPNVPEVPGCCELEEVEGNADVDAPVVDDDDASCAVVVGGVRRLLRPEDLISLAKRRTSLSRTLQPSTNMARNWCR